MSDLPYSSISTSGPDAFDFLQAQLAADIAPVNGSGEPLLAAWCTSKGRVICLFRVTRIDNGYALILPTELADDAVRRLTMFRFRAKVNFAVALADPDQLGVTSSYATWRLTNLHAGIPEVFAQQSEQWTPHMLNLDLIGAVSVDKGCYPGQEIVARTHYRGKTKRRLLRFESAVAVSVGDKMSDGQRDVGEVVNAIGRDFLAVVPVEKRDQPLQINGSPVQEIALPYL